MRRHMPDNPLGLILSLWAQADGVRVPQIPEQAVGWLGVAGILTYIVSVVFKGAIVAYEGSALKQLKALKEEHEKSKSECCETIRLKDDECIGKIVAANAERDKARAEAMKTREQYQRGVADLVELSRTLADIAETIAPINLRHLISNRFFNPEATLSTIMPDSEIDTLDIGKHQRILIVDDNLETVRALKLLLIRQMGSVSVDTALTYSGALELLDRRPHIAILDLNLPLGRSGLDLLTEIKQTRGFDTRVAIMTGDASAAERINSHVPPPDAVFFKPTKLDMFIRFVRDDSSSNGY